MEEAFYEEHWTDSQGDPAGGLTTGRGMNLVWQNGPLGRGQERRAPNGCGVEEVIQAAIGRLEFYQASRFACEANAEALHALYHAAAALERRTRDREERQVEGTHTP